MRKNEPASRAELEEYCERFGGRMYVMIDENRVAFAALSPNEQQSYVDKWLEQKTRLRMW